MDEDGRDALRFAINIIEDDSHELLMVRRAETASLAPGKWGFPGGRMEPDESPEAAAVRELREELGEGLRVRLLRHLGPVADTFYGGRFRIWLFHYRYRGGEVRLNPEHTEWAWVGREEHARYSLMDGIEEDIAYLDIWPRECLRQDRLPPHLRA